MEKNFVWAEAGVAVNNRGRLITLAVRIEVEMNLRIVIIHV
jgi:hypothetical protein